MLATEFERTKHFIRELLERPYAHQWSIQGFGMLRLYLAPELRLHVWDPALATHGVWESAVHDHPWAFTSTVVCGQITNTIYDVRTKEEPGEQFNEQTIVCGPGGCAEGQPTPVTLGLRSCYTYRAGMDYSQAASEVHRSAATPGTVTLVQRIFTKEDRDRAKVYWRGPKWVSAEPCPATRDEIELATRSALLLF